MPVRIDKRSGIPVVSRTDQEPRRKRQGRVPGPGDVAKVDAEVLRDPGLHATPEDFGAGIGAAVADFGKAASRVASDFAEMRREAEDDTAAMAGLSEARVRFIRVAESMKTEATTAEDLMGNLGKALSGETDAILRDLRQVRGLRPSKQGEAAIRRRLGMLASRMVVRGAMSEHRIRLAKLGHDVDAAVAEAAMAAFDSPADFLAIMGETEASLARFKNKLPPDALAAKVAAAREMVAGNAVAGLIEQGDVRSARIMLDAAGSGDDVPLSPEQVGAFRKAVDRVEEQARRAERPAVDALIEDHLASVQATGAGLGGIADRARAALDGKAFKAFQRDEKDARAFHETMESVKFAPPDVIERELETRHPRKGARNFAEKQRRFQVLRRGAKQMLNVRARDGAAFVMEMGDVRAAVEGAGADGPDLRRALKFRMAMQADIGVPEDRVRLLTRAEAGALAGQVQSAAVEDRSAKVAEVQDLYGPLFGRAMKELSEAGLDPRYRALTAARDNPALARTLAEAIEAGGAEVEKDAAKTQEIRDDVRDAAADAGSTAQPGGETAEAIEAIRSAAEDLGVQFFRQTGRKDESVRRAAAFANGAIEEMRLTAADDEDVTGAGDDALSGGEGTIDGSDDGSIVTGGAGDDTLIGDAGAEGSGDDEAPADDENRAPDGTEEGNPLVGPGGEGQTDEKPGKPSPPAVRNAGPPTNKPVDVRDMYNKLGFDPDGRGEKNEFIQAPNTGTKARMLFNDAEEKTAEQIRKGRFPKAGIGGGAADAFRHTYWSYRVTEDLGPDAAKRFGDAHEITVRGPHGGRLMDLFNNNLGRRLALDPANKGRPAEVVVLEAINNGDAQTQPFKTRSTKTRVTPPPGIPLRRKSPSGL